MSESVASSLESAQDHILARFGDQPDDRRGPFEVGQEDDAQAADTRAAAEQDEIKPGRWGLERVARACGAVAS